MSFIQPNKTGYKCMWQDFGHSPQIDAVHKIVSTCLNTVWVPENSNYTGCPIRLNSIGDSFNNSKNKIISSNGKLTLKIATVNVSCKVNANLRCDIIFNPAVLRCLFCIFFSVSAFCLPKTYKRFHQIYGSSI